jgi:hypothetical protein
LPSLKLKALFSLWGTKSSYGLSNSLLSSILLRELQNRNQHLTFTHFELPRFTPPPRHHTNISTIHTRHKLQTITPDKSEISRDRERFKVLVEVANNVYADYRWTCFRGCDVKFEQICCGSPYVNISVRNQSTTEWFPIKKGVRQGCTLSSSLFNLYIEYTNSMVARRH